MKENNEESVRLNLKVKRSTKEKLERLSGSPRKIGVYMDALIESINEEESVENRLKRLEERLACLEALI